MPLFWLDGRLIVRDCARWVVLSLGILAAVSLVLVPSYIKMLAVPLSRLMAWCVIGLPGRASAGLVYLLNLKRSG